LKAASTLAVRSELTIKLLDEEGRVVEQFTFSNSTHSELAQLLTEAWATGATVNAIDAIELWSSPTQVIKTLAPTTRETRSYSDHYDTHVVAEDESDEEYTVERVFAKGGGKNYFFQKGLSVQKASNRKLIVDWVFNVYFSMP